MAEGFNNPYLNARREWDERYGDALARARSWRFAAFGGLAVAALAVAGLAFVGAQSKIKPYVVAIDKMGDPVAMAQPVTGGAVAQRVVESQIANWVWNARTVLADSSAQKELIQRVYSMAGRDAATFLNEWYAKNPPFGGFEVKVVITSVLPLGGDTLQVSWEETHLQGGQVQPTQHWKANITTGIDPKFADSPRVMLNNPLGIFVRDISWTRVVDSNS